MNANASADTLDIRVEVDGPIGWLVVDNRRRRNALTKAMWLALPGRIAALSATEGLRAIVLRGGGEEDFVSGADISEFGDVRRDAATSRDYEAANVAAFAALREAALPTVAMIRGFCLGGGMGLAAACDIRIVARGARFAVPAGRLGLAYPPEAIADFVRLIGPAKTKDLIFTSRRIDAAEAAAAGFADHLVEADDLEAFTRAYVADIARLAPLTLKAARLAIAAVGAGPASAAQVRALAAAEACFDSADYTEGRAAFAQKREPVFKGG